MTILIMVTITGVSFGAYANALEQQRFEGDKIRLTSALEIARKTALANDMVGLTIPCNPFDSTPTK